MSWSFTRALDAVEDGFRTWSAKPHNRRWRRRLDGTPIVNDLSANVAEAICREATRPDMLMLALLALVNREGGQVRISELEVQQLNPYGQKLILADEGGDWVLEVVTGPRRAVSPDETGSSHLLPGAGGEQGTRSSGETGRGGAARGMVSAAIKADGEG